jgi:hypothetical protein
VLGNEGFDNLDDLLLLAAGELGDGLEYLTHLASRSRGTPCLENW